MKVTIKTAHGYLSPQPTNSKNPTVRWEYRDTAGEWETLELVGLDLPPVPIPPEPIPPEPIPPEPIPPQSADAIDLSAAIVASGDCPAVAHLAILSAMATISLTHADQGYAMNFPGRDTWPGVIPPGWDGPINHTLWIAERINGTWYVLPIKECLHDYCTLGPILNPGQIPQNLCYFAQSPMNSYQPQSGEQIGFFSTTGDTRRMNLQPLSGVGRTNVVLVPFAAGDYHW